MSLHLPLVGQVAAETQSVWPDCHTTSGFRWQGDVTHSGPPIDLLVVQIFDPKR